MSDTPTLYACNVRPDHEDATGRTLVSTLAPLGATNTVSPDQELCSEILSKLHLRWVPIRWTCIPFRTSYYSDPEAVGPDRWRIVWTLSIKVDRTVAEIPRRRYECLEVKAGGEYSTAPPEEAMNL